MNTAQSLNQLSNLDIKIEKLEGGRQHIFAKIEIPYSIEQVWQVITDYESFADFIPNMTACRRIQHPSTGIRLEQIRTKNLVGMKVSARSVVDVEEKCPHEVHYQQIEGDLKEFSGYWRLQPKSLAHSSASVELIYDFAVAPKPIIPAPVLSHFLNHDIPAILLAVRQRVETLFG
jgi:ribosome-associated toxin RatA of RatAB toxin-antitoxin module